MVLAHKQFDAIDEAGNLLANVEVRVEIEGGSVVSLYSDRAGATPIGNPATFVDGRVDFYCAGGAYKITLTKGGYSRVLRYVPVGLLQEGDAVPVFMGGMPTGGSSGQVLKKASANDYDLAWQDENTVIANDSVTNAKLANVSTATIKGRTTAGTGDPEDLTAAQARAVLGLATSDSPQFAGLNVGHASDTTITRDSAGVIAVEGVPLFSNIPQNSRSAAYTLVLADAQKHIFHPSADTTGRTWTIPANSSVAFPVGTAITFINENGAGNITIAITSDTLRLAGAGSTGSRTLAANGIATAIKVTSTSWIISGTGLT